VLLLSLLFVADWCIGKFSYCSAGWMVVATILVAPRMHHLLL
jgi:hypothetical protein